ncbi:MAG: hypothetical protein ACP5N1_04375 [Candidatus Woesearchaeota archaeon]
MNKTIKKIVALGMGATMLAGTAAMALATDLSDYPSPFVQNGVFGGKIVLGETADTIDTIGALDIATSLQRLATVSVNTGSSSTATVVGGATLASGSSQVYLGSALDAQVDTLTKEDFADLLADGTFEDDDGEETDYEQVLLIGSNPAVVFDTPTSDIEDPALFLDISDDAETQAVYTWKVTFDEAIDFDDDLSRGEKIELFGKEYTVGPKTDGTYLQLLGGSADIFLNGGEEKTVEFNDQTYVLKLVMVDADDDATILVNGEVVTISEGSTKKVGGMDLYVDSASQSSKDSVPDFVKIQVGAKELWLSEGDSVMVGSSKDEIDGTFVDFTGTTGALTQIQISVAADDSDNAQLAIGDKFKDPVFGALELNFAAMPNGPMLDAQADDSSKRKMVSITVADDRALAVNFENNNGKDATLEWAYQGSALADADNNPIVVVEGASLTEDYYTILNSGNYQHFIEITKVDLTNDSTANDDVVFKDVFTGTVYDDVTDKDFGEAGDTTTVTISGQTYTLEVVDHTAETFKIYTADYATNTVVYPYIETVSGKDHKLAFTDRVTLTADVGQIIELPTGTYTVAVENSTEAVGSVDYTFNYTGATSTLAVSVGSTNAGILFVGEEDDTDSDAMNALLLTATDDGSYTELSTPVFTAAVKSNFETFDDTDYKGQLDAFGVYYVQDGSDDDQTVGWFTYPAEQMYAQVFVAPLDAEVVVTGSTSGAVALNPIGLGMAIMDSEATLGSKPYIVVGGPCANSVAAALMGNPVDCAAGFTEGKAMIKLFSSQNAILVAGYSGKDTQGASRVLADYSNPMYALTGTEVEVTTANLQSLSVKTLSN